MVSDTEHVVDAVGRLGADAVIVAGPTKGGSDYVQELGWKLEESAVQLILTTGLTNVAGPRIHSRPVEGLPLMHVELPQYAGGKHLLKRGMDIVLSGLALLALVPVFLILALLVRRDSPGPVLFRQERVGRGGEVFEMLKFRSMVQTAEDDLAGLLDRNEGSGLLFKMQHDPRVTNVGRWMRKYSLDELPQLWNVFLGHMSLVGPRPPLPREVAQYGNRVHRRLYIKPGLTGHVADQRAFGTELERRRPAGPLLRGELVRCGRPHHSLAHGKDAAAAGRCLLNLFTGAQAAPCCHEVSRSKTKPSNSAQGCGVENI